MWGLCVLVFFLEPNSLFLWSDIFIMLRLTICNHRKSRMLPPSPKSVVLLQAQAECHGVPAYSAYFPGCIPCPCDLRTLVLIFINWSMKSQTVLPKLGHMATLLCLTPVPWLLSGSTRSLGSVLDKYLPGLKRLFSFYVWMRLSVFSPA